MIRREAGAEPSREFIESCADATAGNPFLVLEVLRAIRSEALDQGADTAGMIATLRPQNVARHVAVRLARFGEEAVALARAIAVLGGSPQLRRAGGPGRAG